MKRIIFTATALMTLLWAISPSFGQEEKKQEILTIFKNAQNALQEALELTNDTIALITNTPANNIDSISDQVLKNLDLITKAMGNIYTGSPKKSKSSEKSTNGLSSAGNGFYYKNVSLKSGSLGPGLIGEIVNNSGRSYQLVNFTVSVYGKNGTLLENGYINISNMGNQVTKSFSVYLLDTDVSKINKYKIQFENGL